MKSSPHFVRKENKCGIVWYVYAWRGGPQIIRYEGAKKPKLRANDWARIAEAGKLARKPKTALVAGALTAFRQSKYWRDKAETTKKTWSTALDKIETKWGEVPLAVFDDPRVKPKIVAWRDSMEETPRAADIAVSVLSHFLKWASLAGHVQFNHAREIPTIYRPSGRAPVIWLAEDIEAIKAVSGQQLHDAIDLAVLTGFRLSDLVSLRWDEVNDLEIRKVASKTSRGRRFYVKMPRLPQLGLLLENLRTRPRKEGVETVLVNSFGTPWTADGLGSTFYDARKLANEGTGIWHTERDPRTGEEWRTPKRIHDLRGTFATRVMSQPGANVTNDEMAQLMGWSSDQVNEICKRYVDDTHKVVDLTRRLAGDL